MRRSCPRSPTLGLARGLVAQFIKVVTQAALDHGAVDMARTFRPEPDAVRPTDRGPIPPPVEQADPFSGQASAEELSAGMAWRHAEGGPLHGCARLRPRMFEEEPR